MYDEPLYKAGFEKCEYAINLGLRSSDAPETVFARMYCYLYETIQDRRGVWRDSG